jgi:hypothetical protein
MPIFQAPDTGELGEYDLDGKFQGSIWRMRSARGRDAGVALWGADAAAGFVVRSNNPTVIPNPLKETVVGNLRVFQLNGLNLGTTLIEVSHMGTVWTTLQVQVVAALESGHTGDRLVQLTAPHMVLNMAGSPTVMKMQYSYTIAKGVSAKDMIAKVKQAGRLKHLVINCHGYMNFDRSGATGSTLEIGAGFSQPELFAELKSTCRGGVIWLSGCVVGNDEEGNRKRAALSGCHVVAPINYMQQKERGVKYFPLGKVDMLERFQPKVFSPEGVAIGWPSLIRMGRQFGIAVT